MSLESTVVCVDDSEWMRNGDFYPSRLEAQRDALQMVCGKKIAANPESTVGLMTMANRPEVLVTLTAEFGKIMSQTHRIQPNGNLDFVNSLKVAKLALKFRQSKNHRQRIIAFVGSPISTSKEELTKMGKKFKKDNVAVDVINFGTEEDNVEKLTAFVEAVDNKNSERRSHFLNVPSGVGQLSEHIMQSPICDTPDSGGGGGGGGGSVADAGFGGVDANMDPELALALRVSMEEERERQAKAAREAGEPAADAAGDAAEATNIEGAGMQDAVAAQLQEMEQAPDAGGGGAQPSFDMMSEEEQMRLALQMSMEDAEAAQPEPAAAEPAEDAKMETAQDDPTQDEAFLAEVLSQIPVDQNDDAIKEALALSMADQEKEGDGDAEKK